MNSARVAALLRERARLTRETAELDEQIAEAVEAEAGEPAPRRNPAKTPRPLTEIDRARARKALRRVGVDV